MNSTCEYNPFLGIMNVGSVFFRCRESTFHNIRQLREVIHSAVMRKMRHPHDAANNSILKDITSVTANLATTPTYSPNPMRVVPWPKTNAQKSRKCSYVEAGVIQPPTLPLVQMFQPMSTLMADGSDSPVY
eukprot:CAMPEP_0177677794 /NCGR_PEP_ID=MMETSP0447-20121125/28617_1 /TAXON_ID=0 /ORGANISM="Stygamoeba regulata, Strain BSH-02190019" /LENGTH=130 /DNA_ID=CAMNT_0019186657 /DNA_START=1 /DNA_END=390 /DNA_ORIENTATION=-